MWWPRLNQDHVASNQTCGIGSASRVCSAPKHHCSIIVRWITQYFMKLDSESVEMTNVQGAKVGMKSIVEKCIINCEVNRG